MSALLRDPARCAFIPVTLPETLSLAETERLIAGLERTGMPIAAIVLNKISRAPGDRRRVLQAEGRRIARRLRTTYAYPLVEIPLYDDPPIGADALRILARRGCTT